MSKKDGSPGFSWLLKMALRDGKASLGKLSLFMASIVIGIAAVVSIESFSESLQLNIDVQSKALMGADYLIDSRKPANDRVKAIIDSLGGADAEEINFSSMALFPKNGSTKFVRVVGMQGDFPFYGELLTEPLDAAKLYQKQGAALVDKTVMIQYQLEVGDSVKIGKKVFPIGGVLVSAPGSTGFSTGIAPPVYIPLNSIGETELIQLGSRLEYQYYFKASENQDLFALESQIGPVLDLEDADLDTHHETSQRLGERYENFIVFLNLVAFIALLLGCIGIASSVNIYIKEKVKSIAILKCLGASRAQSFKIFAIQIGLMGLFGGLFGSALGYLIQQLFPLVFEDFLPFDIILEFGWNHLLLGIMLGILMSVLFALIPLINTWYVSPLSVLRISQDGGKQRKRVLFWGGIPILIFLFSFSFWILADLKASLYFLLGLVVILCLLGLLSAGLMRTVKKFFPSQWNFAARQSLLNLFRPQNQTTILILTIGMGSFLISTLFFSKDMLLSKLSIENQNDTPNLILLDVQSDQKKEVAQLLDPLIDNIPIVTMRVNSINGRLADDIRKDSSSGINPWMLDHEFRVTYRDSIISSEKIVAGDWVPSQTFVPGKSVKISIAESIARDGRLGVGDSLTFNVQGMPISAEVANIRQVDWGRMQPNFSLVFPKGVLENAPQFNVLTTKVTDEQDSAELQSKLIQNFPNISILDLRQILSLIDDILSKISWVINFMAFFSIITGIIVLIGAIRNSKYQRIRENVLLRTLGATNVQIRRILLLEYAYLGLIGSLGGVLLSLLASQILAVSVFEAAFQPSWIPFGLLFPGITLLVVTAGMLSSNAILKSSPLLVLRKES